MLYAKALIKSQLNQSEKKEKLLAKYLKEDVTYYIEKSLPYLKEAGDNFEIENLNALKI